MRTLLWISVLVIAVAYGVYAFATLDRRTDDEQIVAIVTGTSDAINSRNLGDTMSYVSQKYKDDAGNNFDRIGVLMGQVYRADVSYRFTSETLETDINGDKAHLKLHVLAKNSKGSETLYERTLDVTLVKENARHALLVPAKKWRVTEVSNIGISPTGEF